MLFTEAQLIAWFLFTSTPQAMQMVDELNEALLSRVKHFTVQKISSNLSTE